MSQSFLEQESIRANKRQRKFIGIVLLIWIGVVTFLIFATKDSIDMNDDETQKLVICFGIMAVIIIVSIVIVLLRTSKPALKGENLILPFKEDTKEAVAKIIDQEVAEDKILLEEYMDYFSEGAKPHGSRIILLPTYMLLFDNVSRITAIPRDEICWVCPQVGYKGGPFYMRLLIFTKQQCFEMDTNDEKHTQEIAKKIYKFIPNVFSDYKLDDLSYPYTMQKLYDENRAGFFEFYESEKKKSYCSQTSL